MSWILLATLATAPVAAEYLKIAPAQAAEMLAVDLPEGSLIFSQGDCLAVKIYTASRYTHVGAVVEHSGKHWVYDSTGGAGVRVLTLNEYLASQGAATVAVYRPAAPLSARQKECFETHLKNQLGRPYAIKHHLTGRRADGLHCAEYATDALIAGELMDAKHPPKVSPASLRHELEKSGLYTHDVTLQLEPEPVRPPAEAGWCRRIWFETTTCSRNCYRKLSAWFCCK